MPRSRVTTRHRSLPRVAYRGTTSHCLKLGYTILHSTIGRPGPTDSGSRQLTCQLTRQSTSPPVRQSIIPTVRQSLTGIYTIYKNSHCPMPRGQCSLYLIFLMYSQPYPYPKHHVPKPRYPDSKPPETKRKAKRIAKQTVSQPNPGTTSTSKQGNQSRTIKAAQSKQSRRNPPASLHVGRQHRHTKETEESEDDSAHAPHHHTTTSPYNIHS